MRVGVVDLGTNTARLLIADVIDGRITDVMRAVDVVGLGVGVDRSGAISQDALDRLGGVLEEYSGALAAAGIDRGRVIATSAARDAANRAELISLVSASIGLEPEIVTGDEEARLAFAGAVHGVGMPGVNLVIDPGGGSTEFVVGEDRPEYIISIDIGSVRLTDRLLPDRPASPDMVRAARLHVADLFAAVRPPRAADTVLGVAGTFTSLAAIHLGLAVYDRTRVHRSTLTVSDLDSLVDRLAGLTVAETAAIPSLDPKRAAVLLAGAVVASEAVRLTGVGRVLVSESDSLDGMALALSRG